MHMSKVVRLGQAKQKSSALNTCICFANCFEPPKELLRKKQTPKLHILKGQTHVRKVHPISILLSHMACSQRIESTPKVHPGLFKAFVCFCLDDLFRLECRKYSLKHDMCKRCHSVKKNTFKKLGIGCTVRYIQKWLVLVSKPECLSWEQSNKEFPLGPRVSMLQNIHFCFHIFHSFQSSLSHKLCGSWQLQCHVLYATP